MSEQKICPYLLMASRFLMQQAEGVGFCLEDKCAMWHPKEHIVIPERPPAHEYDIPGYCGLAGKP